MKTTMKVKPVKYTLTISATLLLSGDTKTARSTMIRIFKESVKDNILTDLMDWDTPDQLGVDIVGKPTVTLKEKTR